MRWRISFCYICFLGLTSAFHDDESRATSENVAAEHRSIPDADENQSNQGTDNRSFLSPRMDYDQWKPIGRGDPLQNDPTYDYVPPVLEKVHYWIDPASRKIDDPQRGEKRKSEVLVLGVSSKKPSAINSNIRKDAIENSHKYLGVQKMYHHNIYSPHMRPNNPHRNQPNSANAIFSPYYKNKYEGLSYRGEDQSIPLTILVPPPPPPPRTDTMYFVQQMPSFASAISSTPSPSYSNVNPIEQTPNLSYHEANLIFQSSSTNGQEYWKDINNGIHNDETAMNRPSSWHSTTASPIPAFVEVNHTESNLHNVIQFENNEEITESTPLPAPGSYSVEIIPSNPYSPDEPTKTFVPSLFLYNSSNDTPSIETTPLEDENIKIPEDANNFTDTQPISLNYMEVAPPNENHSYSFTEPPTAFLPTESYFETPQKQISKNTVLDMMRPMLDIPITAPAKINNQTFNVFKPVLPTIPPVNTFNLQNTLSPSFSNQNELLESMQTIQPPPVTRTERIPTILPQSQNYIHGLLQKEAFSAPNNFVTSPIMNTTPTSTTPTVNTLTTDPIFKHYKQPKEPVTGPMYLIIQGHSKVKTYSGAKKKTTIAKESSNTNEVEQLKDQYVVKHLHTRKDNINKESVEQIDRTGRNLKHLINDGVGRIEVQEANLGIKYDVSDGSGVPVEIYHQGIVESEDLVYDKVNKPVRSKRGIIDSFEETVESFIYNYLKKKSQEKGLGGILASAVTSDAAEEIDDLEYES